MSSPQTPDGRCPGDRRRARRTHAGRIVGRTILEQDTRLDDLARTAATKLQSPLPSPAAADPALEQLKAAKGETFDAGYVDRLRQTVGGRAPAWSTSPP
jgi:hypothetical protein